MKLISFQDALHEAKKYNKKHVLLGNGFSIACRPKIFTYGRLYEQADFSRISETAKLGFEALGTQDFERVIKALRDTAEIAKKYRLSQTMVSKLTSDADGLRELLVQTIASSHPAWPGEITESEYACCRSFLANFDTIYTLNYDLLLYWTKMHTADDEKIDSDDGFRTPDENWDASYVAWESSSSHGQNMWFLHGALHVFDSGTEIQKYTWSKTQIRLIDQIRSALSKNLFPIFVSEGTSKEKLERIRHNDYLAKAYRSFESIQGALFIYGHSLAENDDHYLKCIEKGKTQHLYIGLYGNINSDSNKFIARRANQISNSRRARRSLALTFYDASSASVWQKHA